MKKFNEEEFNKNWIGIVSLLQSNERLSKVDFQSLGEQLKNCAGALDDDSGIAYPGGLAEHMFKSMCLAAWEANMLNKKCPSFSIDINSLYLVTFLMQISKIEMFMKNPDEYQASKFGKNYTFAETEGKLKSGLRSVVWCMNHGIALTPVEVEAMTVFDRDPSQASAMSQKHDNIMTTIVRQANELAYAIERELAKK